MAEHNQCIMHSDLRAGFSCVRGGAELVKSILLQFKCACMGGTGNVLFGADFPELMYAINNVLKKLYNLPVSSGCSMANTLAFRSRGHGFFEKLTLSA